MTLTCEHCGSNYPHPHHPGCIEGENARLRALLDERTALLRECEEERLLHLAAIGVNGLKAPDKLSRRIAATLKETTCDS